MRPLALYVHIPFCTVKCGYCDFNAYAGLDAMKPAYRDAVLAELDSWEPVLRGRDVISVAFGGGTPGEVPPEHLAAMIGRVRELGRVAPDAEIGIEANPGTTGHGDLLALRRAGVNRVSFGAQSFQPEELRFLDRIHSPEATVASVTNARRAGIASVGMDLIYGLPAQLMAAWEYSLRRAIDLAPDHLSLYGLTVEDGTRLGRRVREGSVLPLDGDEAAEMYERATDLLATAGFRQYELSNWAQPGHESRHNQVYWRDGDYLGIGAGAHGYIGGERYENVAAPREYVRKLQSPVSGNRPAVRAAYRPTLATAMFDWVSLALRLIEGFAPAQFQARFGVSLDDTMGLPLSECELAGLLARGCGRVRLTRAGRLLHGEVSVRLLAHLREREPVSIGTSTGRDV